MRNYLGEMLYALTSAYTRKDYDNQKRGLSMETNIGKLFYLLAWGLDSVEEQAELIQMWDDLDNACGSVLDRYGANWGVKRISPNDAIYRIAIKVKVLAQLSGGDVDTVIQAAASLLDVSNSDILLEEVFPAKIAVYVDWDLLTQERKDLIEAIAEAIKRIIAAGVGFRLYIRTYRTSRFEISFSRAVFADVDLTGPPVGIDRKSTSEFVVGHTGFAESYFAPPPHSEDKAFTEALWAAHGAARDSALSAYPPDVDRPLTSSQSRAGGAVYHSHIKAKRVN